MTLSTESIEREATSEVAFQLKQAGYDVRVEPGSKDLPFDLRGYQPDLVGRKGDGGVIIEVKASEARSSIDTYAEVAHIVQQHPGWRFVLVPADRLRQQSFFELVGLASMEQIEKRAKAARELLASGMHAPAFITAWSGIEGLLRRRAEEQAVPAIALSTGSLIKQLYSHGLLSLPQFRELEALLKLRAAVVHGLSDEGVVEASANVVRLFDEIRGDVTPKVKAS
jgi:hypothetical protein